MREEFVLLLRYLALTVYVMLLIVPSLAQTKLTGRVYDSHTGKGIAGVSIRADVSVQGTSTDTSGFFQLSIAPADQRLSFSLIGYRFTTLPLSPQDTLLEVFLEEDEHTIETVDIHRKVKYRRKNPATELIDLVIQHKNQNRLEKKDNLYYQQYEKIKFGLVDPNELLKTKLGKMSFFFRNVDTSSMPGNELLTMYMEEVLSDHYTKQNPSRSKKIIRAQEKTEFNTKYINNENIQSYLNYLFQPVDIYDESIFFVSKQFLSPIADNGKTYYKYYLIDTVKTAGEPYVRLRFEPFNKADLLFQGELAISLDGRYAVKHAHMQIDGKMNINWVNGLTVDLSYSPNEDGIMLQDTARVLVIFGRGKRDAVFGERMSLNSHYNFKDDIPSAMVGGAPTEIRIDPSLSLRQERPIMLNTVERKTYTNVDSLNNVKTFNTLLSIGYLLAQSYYSFDKFELGPLEYAYHQNNWEGNRFRLGGRTTGGLSEKTYLEGYLAYGTRDQELKYYLRAAQSLNGKSVFTFPAHYMEGMIQQDVFDPGRSLGFLKGDSFFQGLRSTRPKKWLDTEAYRLGHVLEFGNHLSVATHFTHQRRNPLGDLSFPLSGNPNEKLTAINTNDIQFVLRWAPKEKFYYRNIYRTSIIERYPVFSVQYNKGLDGFWSSHFTYDALRVSVSKRWFMNQLGYGDMTITGGKIWGVLPYPLLEMPTVQANNDRHSMSFDLVNSMEFVADQFVKVSYDHQFQGFILNKIPLIKWFKLREIWGARMFYGQLSENNNPYKSTQVVNFDHDEDGNTMTYAMDKYPYWEGYVGLDNIFKIFRLQYFYRYNYLQHANITRDRFKVSLNVNF